MKTREVDKIHANAAGARGAYDAFIATLDESQAALLRKYFHLRPNGKGVAIVSTLEYAPMSSTLVKIPKLRKAMDSLWADMPVLTGFDRKAAVACLKKHGFRPEKKKLAQETALRAAFIRGLVCGEPGYEGVQFITSGLCLDKKAPFVVVGHKDNALHLFGVSAVVDAKAVTQTEAARGMVLDALNNGRQKAAYERVLRDFPGTDIDTFESVCCTAVLSGEAFSPVARLIWAQENNAGSIRLWFFESGLQFFSC